MLRRAARAASVGRARTAKKGSEAMGRRSWFVRAAWTAACLLAAACTSPDSVRKLSASQGERMKQFSAKLAEALEIAREDRKLRIQTLIDGTQTQIDLLSASDKSKADNADKIAALRRSGEELSAALAANETAYASFPAFVDEVLIPGNEALDEWHHRWGVSLVDSDSVAAFAAASSTKGVTKESLQSLAYGLKTETKGEAAETAKNARAAIDVAGDAKKLAQGALDSVGVTQQRVAEIQAEIAELKRLVEELKKGAK
jgi:hypothetical protein